MWLIDLLSQHKNIIVCATVTGGVAWFEMKTLIEL